jgi:hypothetical protein
VIRRAALETLERRTLLAVTPVTNSIAVGGEKLDPIEANPAARYVPETSFVFERNGFLTGPSDDAPLTIALDYIRDHAADLGINTADVGQPIVTSQYTDSDGGITHIYLRQQVGGLEVGNADLNVNVMTDGRILSIGSAFVSDVAQLADRVINPALDAVAALGKAASNLGLSLSHVPQVLMPGAGTARVTTLRANDVSLDEIPTRLKYIATPNGLQLAWQFVLRTPDGEHWYDTSVSASDGKMLFTADWVTHDEHDDADHVAEQATVINPATIRATVVRPATAGPRTRRWRSRARRVTITFRRRRSTARRTTCSPSRR